jgi:hypothetical protein
MERKNTQSKKSSSLPFLFLNIILNPRSAPVLGQLGPTCSTQPPSLTLVSLFFLASQERISILTFCNTLEFKKIFKRGERRRRRKGGGERLERKEILKLWS